MNEKMQYASMLELPVCTCNVSSTTIKKKKAKKIRKHSKQSGEQIKQEVLDMVNSEQDLTDQNQNLESEVVPEQVLEQGEVEQEISTSVHPYKHKRKLKFSIVGVQLVIIGFLVGAILLTNALYADSGINVFLRGVFGTEQVQVDSRTFDEFSPIISMGDNKGVNYENGVITYNGEGSVYAPCDGVVSGIIQTEDGKFEIEIKHSQNFKSVISDIEHLYVGVGDNVYRTIPVGYLQSDGASICFKDESGALINDYQIVDNMVVWQE